MSLQVIFLYSLIHFILNNGSDACQFPAQVFDCDQLPSSPLKFLSFLGNPKLFIAVLSVPIWCPDSLSPDYIFCCGYHSQTFVETFQFSLLSWWCESLSRYFVLIYIGGWPITNICSQSCQWPGSGVLTYAEQQCGKSITLLYAALDGEMCNGSKVAHQVVFPGFMESCMKAPRVLLIMYIPKYSRIQVWGIGL